MRRLYLGLLACILSISAWSQQTINGSITHDGLSRNYILYVPDTYQAGTPAPLVMNFHGYTSDANAQMFYGDFRKIADTAGFLLVHPQGTRYLGNTHWNVGGWTNGSTVDDVGFVDALIDSLSVEYSIDPKRVYSTGMSNGGYMSYLLACQLSHKIAAIASVTGSMTTEIYNSCDPKHPTPIMQIHGTADPVVPYNGNAWSKSMADVMSYWIRFNACDPTPTIFRVPDINMSDGSTAEQFVYSSGNNGVTNEHFKVTNGAHTWPGTNFSSPGTNQDFNASLEIWKFFARYDIDGASVPVSVDQNDYQNVARIYPNPTENEVFVEFVDHQIHRQIQILSLDGRVLLEKHSNPGKMRISTTHLPNGMYLLRVGDRSQKLIIAR